VTGKNVSLVVKITSTQSLECDSRRFGVAKKINIAVFGHGLVGGTLINQILESAAAIEKEKISN
jgi:aspartokinase/homoserine dehydrogenase 1